MHTLTFFFFFSTLLTLVLATESQFGQPWYPDHKYKSWRRGRRWNPPCTPEALELGVPCRDSLVLTNEKPMPVIVHPTLGPVSKPPLVGRSAKDMWFAKFVAEVGERKDENVGVGKREGKGVKGEKKEARWNIFYHFRVHSRPSVHDSGSRGSE